MSFCNGKQLRRTVLPFSLPPKRTYSFENLRSSSIIACSFLPYFCQQLKREPPMSKSLQRKTIPDPFCQPLENRLHLDATLTNGVLMATGTSNNDTITVSLL